jgi:hypothetical protein
MYLRSNCVAYGSTGIIEGKEKWKDCYF